MAVFVWTFHGVMDAIALGVMLLVFALVGMLVGWVKLLEWWERRKRKPNRVL
jgi:predicted membrane metal-binding protein